MGMLNGIYTGLHHTEYDIESISGVNDLDNFIAQRVHDNQADSIESIVMFPTVLSDGGADEPAEFDFNVARPEGFISPFEDITAQDVDRYEARNNKLYAYPFKYFSIDTMNDSHDYRYEYFDQSDAYKIKCYGVVSPNPQILIAPRYYNHSISDFVDVNKTYNMIESVTMTGFPQCAFTIDSYSQWLAQNAVSNGISEVSAAIGIAGGAAMVAGGVMTGGTGAILGGAMSAGYGAVGLAQSINAQTVAKTSGARTRGNQGSNGFVALRQYSPHIRCMSITKEKAQIIDDYFDRFGYICNRIKIPNTHVRQNWTYTKTRECNLYGNIPEDDAEKIKSIFNNGITFWINHNNVGDYSLPNATLT